MAKTKTMLRTFAALVWREASGPEGHGRQGSGLDKHGLWVGAVIAVSVLAAAGVLSMVFPWRARRLQGIWGGGFERPCLADLLPAGGGEGMVRAWWERGGAMGDAGGVPGGGRR